jgi:hypothetical protein
MIKVNIDINQLKNELTMIHNELFASINGTDNQRRDAVNLVVEKIRTLKNQIDNIEVIVK